MEVVTAEEMRAIEKSAMEALEVSSLVLMENAGSRIVEVLKANYGPLTQKRIHILAGMGNNGGDGLVVARQLLTLKARPKVYLIGKSLKTSPEHELNLKILQNLGADLVQVDLTHLAKLKFSLSLADLIVDCLYGTGFTGKLTSEIEAFFNLINGLESPLVAVDVPSGVDATTGQVAPTALKADLTINLGFLKTGCLLYPGQDFAGKNVVVDLGVPLQGKINRTLLDRDILSFLPERPAWGHKGTFGHALVIGGSKTYAGAPALCGQGVLRGGAGLVTVAIPQSIASRFKPDELILAPIASQDGYFGEESISELESMLVKKDVLVIGPGIGDGSGVSKVVQSILTKWNKPAVIDADALKSLTTDFLKSLSPKQRQQWVITPHPGEMASLINLSPLQVNQERLKIAQDYALKWGMVVVLKGAPTIITNGEKTYINSTGNHALGTGGTGDVLAGLIGSFLAQGLNPLEASCVGVYAHGATADLSAKYARSFIASDCLRLLPEILA